MQTNETKDIITIASDIEWDTTDTDEPVDLPASLTIPPEYAKDEETISDYLSDVTGFCHFGYTLNRIHPPVVITVSQKMADRINRALAFHGESEDDPDYLTEDETIYVTAVLDENSKLEADIKCCGSHFEEGGDNSAWTEGVLFQNGAEIYCTEPSDTFFGDWEFTNKEDTYTVTINVA